jgi:hypothetical protein
VVRSGELVGREEMAPSEKVRELLEDLDLGSLLEERLFFALKANGLSITPITPTADMISVGTYAGDLDYPDDGHRVVAIWMAMQRESQKF